MSKSVNLNGSERSFSSSSTEKTMVSSNYCSFLNPLKAYLRFRQAKILTVEPVIFLYMFGIFMYLSMGQEYVFNWYGRRMLQDHANFTAPFNFCISTELLDNMIPRNETDGSSAGDFVQAQASILSLVTTLLGQFPSVFAALLYGPMTDRVGRRPIMLLMGSTGAISGFLFTLAVTLNWSIYWFVPITLITSLTGGIPGILTVVYSYVADVSSTKWLTLRLGIVESMIFFGSMSSLALGGVWLDATNCEFAVPFVSYFVANLLILVYVIFLLPPSLSHSQRTARHAATKLSWLQHIGRGLKIFFTKNEYSRWRLWCAVGSMFIIYLVLSGASEISTLFLLHAPLKWDPGSIGIFQALTQLSFALAIFLFMPLFVYLRVPDPAILLVGVLWGAGCYLLTGFVRTGWEMYAVGVLQGLQGVVGAPIRSIISKAVALSDQGAAFSILSSIEVLASSCAAVIFYFSYPITLALGLSAGTSYFLMALISLLQLPFTVVLLVYRKRPGAVYKAQKSISEREKDADCGGEQIADSEDDEDPNGKETDALLPRANSQYGTTNS